MGKPHEPGTHIVVLKPICDVVSCSKKATMVLVSPEVHSFYCIFHAKHYTPKGAVDMALHLADTPGHLRH